MATFNPSALHTGTPSLAVLCSRGLPVGELACYRAPAAEAVELRITRHQYNSCGQLALSRDPRLAETATPNFRWHSDLAGRPVRTESVDAGSSVALPDVAGRPLLTVSATGVSQVCIHETPSLPGRLLAVTEQGAGEALPRVAERYRWAGLSSVEKHRNLAGQCVRHYDTAGLIELQNLALSGAALAQSRCVLAGEDDADWAGDDEQAWQSSLEPERYVTLRTLDAMGIQLTQTDARGHQQRQAYDVAGQLQGSWLTLQGQAEQAIVASLCYSPSGHKQQEVHGNGVITDYGLDPMTQRLTGIRVQRPGIRTLQDLHYRYDPVGNVQSVRNDAEATRFWRNQKVTAESTFTYDSLYQLMQATGREMVGRGAQGPQLPDVLVPLPTDESVFTNYTRRYSYDRAGNLIQMQHSAPASNNAYTTQMTVSNRSNRAVLAREGLLPEQVDELFDAGGHQLELLAGQDLRWNARGELAQVKPIQREAKADDVEWYRYGSDGMRLLKMSEQQAAGVTQAQRVLYLDGLELRDTGEDTRLHVIKVAAGGGAQVQVLHWASGLPAGLDNDQVRYSYHNLIGSSGLELDGQGAVINQEEYYPFGGTSVWTARRQVEAEYKTVRYSGKERDASGLYYYGYRYFQPWAGRWLSADPGETVDGLNLFRMVRNNPVTLHDVVGMSPEKPQRTGVIYSFATDEETASQIAGQLSSRHFNKKDLLTVVVRDEQAELDLRLSIERRVEKDRRAIRRAEAKIDTLMSKALITPLRVDKLQRFRAYIARKSREIDILEQVEIAPNDKGRMLQDLKGSEHKLYVFGHSAAGSNTLWSGAKNQSRTARMLAQELSDGGLPKDFEDVRVVACGSADSFKPSSFAADVLEASANPLVAGDKPYAARLSNVLGAKGYSKIQVTGYHGNLKRNGKHGYQRCHLRAQGGIEKRRSLVARKF